MKPWHGVAIGLVAYIVFVIAGAPASKLMPLLQRGLPGVQLAGVAGTVWSGEAALVNAPPVEMHDVRWRFRPLALLLGRAEVALGGELHGRPLQGRAGRGLFGQPYLSRVRGAVAAQDVLSWLRLGQVGLAGILDFDLEDVRWSDQPWPAVEGTLNWSPANVVRPVALTFGKAQLETRIEGDATRGTLDASGGALQVQGTVEFSPGGDYRLDAQLQQKGDVPAEVSRFLSTFTEYKNGSYLFEWSDAL